MKGEKAVGRTIDEEKKKTIELWETGEDEHLMIEEWVGFFHAY